MLLLGAEGTAALTQARERIVVAKSCSRRSPLVAWAARPPSAVICLSSQEQYGLFAAAVPPRAGAVLSLETILYPATDRTVYRYRDGRFEGALPPSDTIPKRHYGIRNDGSNTMAFGLLQRSSADEPESLQPLNFVVLAPGVPAELLPDDDIVVWTAVNLSPGTVISALPAGALVLPWRGERWQCCAYDIGGKSFVWIGGCS